MLGSIFVDVLVIICAFWTFFDAANHKIGVRVLQDGFYKGQKRGFHPVVWAIGAIFILPFVIYLFQRKSLITAAQQNPADTDKSLGFIILLILIAVITIYSYKDWIFP